MQINEFTDPLEADLKDVSDWLSVSVNELNVVTKQEPMSMFKTQALEMYNTFEEFPEDAERTQRIVDDIRDGGDIYPVYVEAGDPAKFVMEGRHRMVAFLILKLDTIPVSYASVKDK